MRKGGRGGLKDEERREGGSRGDSRGKVGAGGGEGSHPPSLSLVPMPHALHLPLLILFSYPPLSCPLLSCLPSPPRHCPPIHFILRSRKGRSALTVSCLDTLQELKLKIFQALDVHPGNAQVGGPGKTWRGGGWHRGREGGGWGVHGPCRGGQGPNRWRWSVGEGSRGEEGREG